MKLTKDGYLNTPACILLVAFGIFLIYAALEYVPASAVGYFIVFLGIFLISIGGYASQAATLKIKLFRSSYKNARESYKQDDDFSGSH